MRLQANGAQTEIQTQYGVMILGQKFIEHSILNISPTIYPWQRNELRQSKRYRVQELHRQASFFSISMLAGHVSTPYS